MIMVTVKWRLLLLFFVFLHPAIAQQGFVNIQCCSTSEYTDPRTKIKYKSDDYLLNGTGICNNISGPSVHDLFLGSARVFGNDRRDRWCYDLPVVEGQGYLMRSTFQYGSFLRSTVDTAFSVSIGSTSISLINSSLNFVVVECILAASANNTNICLLKGNGNAYISKVELRPINDPIYLNGKSSSILKLISRVDLGNKNIVYRYPTDRADRIWNIDESSAESNILSSSDVLLRGANSSIPIAVLQTAATNDERLQFLHTDLDTSYNDYLIFLFFLEIDANVQPGQRIFDVYVNGNKTLEKFDILRNVGTSNYQEISMMVKSNGYLNISLTKASSDLKYGPICNAYEIFQLHRKAPETVLRDLNAVVKLREELAAGNPSNVILEKLYGDPCMPPAWGGLTCEERNGNLIITKLDLSSMNLHGPFPTAIGDLADLKELDVRKNEFTGSLPGSLASLRHLSKLFISCNSNFSIQLPPGLAERKNLTVRSEGCVSRASSQTQHKIYVLGTVAGGSVAVTVALGIFFTCFYKRACPSKKQLPVIKNAVFSESSIHESSLIQSVKSFTLQYIERATSNYSTLIGEGGFGAVYRGTLPEGQEVAVKVWSASSTQGTREFDNEVTLLSNIRHENLVPLLGYCCDNNQQILVYPFMSNGSLLDRLYGEASKRKVLDWPTRLSIALGAARGLMYLHSFAGRCIVHRDVKSSNILLDHSMCGKVADFGFSKYAPQEGDSAASLEVRGTAGYLDPEYYSTQQLSAKSDVFSFGVVLLEIVTGREPLNVQRPRNEWSLVEWAKPFIRESRIEEIVDPTIKGGYHAEAMWRVVEAALACIEPFSTYRPSMVDIVRELEDALIIENNASEYMRSIESFAGSNRFISLEGKMSRGSNRFGSNRFISMERKMSVKASLPLEPSPSYCLLPAPLPR